MIVFKSDGIISMFIVITIIPTKMKIIIMRGNNLLQIFEIVFMPFMIIIPARIVMVSEIITLFISYMFVVRVVMVLFWIEVKRNI